MAARISVIACSCCDTPTSLVVAAPIARLPTTALYDSNFLLVAESCEARMLSSTLNKEAIAFRAPVAGDVAGDRYRSTRLAPKWRMATDWVESARFGIDPGSTGDPSRGRSGVRLGVGVGSLRGGAWVDRPGAVGAWRLCCSASAKPLHSSAASLPAFAARLKHSFASSKRWWERKVLPWSINSSGELSATKPSTISGTSCAWRRGNRRHVFVAAPCETVRSVSFRLKRCASCDMLTYWETR